MYRSTATLLLLVARRRPGLQQRLPAWLPGCQIHDSSLGACARACTPGPPMLPYSPQPMSPCLPRPVQHVLKSPGPATRRPRARCCIAPFAEPRLNCNTWRSIPSLVAPVAVGGGEFPLLKLRPNSSPFIILLTYPPCAASRLTQSRIALVTTYLLVLLCAMNTFVHAAPAS